MPSRRHSRHTGPIYLANCFLLTWIFHQVQFTAGSGFHPASYKWIAASMMPAARYHNYYTRLFFGGRQPLCGIGVRSLMALTSMPAVASARTADSRPAPGPLTRTSTLRIPYSLTLLAAVSEA